MKLHLLLCPVLLVMAVHATAAPKDDLLSNRALRADAIQMFRRGNASDAIVRLRSGAKAELRGGDASLEVAQQLVDIAFYFFARRETALARQSLNDSINETRALRPTGRNSVYLANLYCNLGRACDRILHDPEASHRFYSAATEIDPANVQAGERLKVTAEKLRHRKMRSSR